MPRASFYEGLRIIGAKGKGQLVAEMDIAGNPQVEWFFACHFKGDPVMPGCLGLDALWQMLGFFLGWLGAPGRGRAVISWPRSAGAWEAGPDWPMDWVN